MKKIFYMALALLMAFSMAACQSKTTETTPPTEKVTEVSTESTTEATTQATTEAPTEETISQEELNRFRAEESLAADSQTVTYSTPKEYETALHKMGFIEYNGDMYRLTMNGDVSCIPISLTYNDEVFRMEFDFLNFANQGDAGYVVNAELTPVSGWVLYGKKNATASDNISDYDRQDYEFYDFFDPYEGMTDTFHETMVYYFRNSEDSIPNTAYYYPTTNNLYNLLNTQPNIADELGMPVILCETEEDMSASSNFVDKEEWHLDMPEEGKLYALHFDFENPSEGLLKDWPSGYMQTFYIEGMSFLDWMDSEYGDDHSWDIMGNIALYNPSDWSFEENGMYFITDINTPLDELVTFGNDGNVHLTLTTTIPDGFAFVPAADGGMDLSALGDGIQYIPAP